MVRDAHLGTWDGQINVFTVKTLHPINEDFPPDWVWRKVAERCMLSEWWRAGTNQLFMGVTLNFLNEPLCPVPLISVIDEFN
jgi:hypothetical protein